MRDDYEVSVPQVDALVEIASAERDVRRALTGGGFAVGRRPREAREWRAVAGRLAERYRRECAAAPTVLVPAM